MTLPPETQTELTAEQKAELEAARKLIPKLREQITRAKSAGIDMSSQETELAELQAQLDKLYRVYVRSGTPRRGS